jgi:tetratricopeptide (TPR) repeat protein
MSACNGSSSQSKPAATPTKSQKTASSFVPPEELWELNNQGVAYMERFDMGGGFENAVPVFEEIVRRWPEWMPGKFNLAVAYLNAFRDDAHHDQAERLLREVIVADDQDAKAHYTLGFLLKYRNRSDEAKPHFEKVCFELKPDDAHSWLRLGDCLADSASADSESNSPGGALTPLECYERAYQLNPNNATAAYKLGQLLRLSDLERAREFLDKHTSLTKGPHDICADDYIWSGPLAEAIGVKLPSPRPGDKPLPVYEKMEANFELAEGSRWSNAEDLATAHGGLLARVRERFGAGIAAFDFDKDGDLDLFLPASAVQDGKLRDALFRNDGVGRFADVTAEVGLASPRASIGCAVGDFDADHFPDLYVTTIGGNVLFRNAGGKSFEDVTDRAGVAEADSISLSALFLDIDHDSDLDLIVSHYGPLADADKLFRDEPPTGKSRNAIFNNVGKARTDDADPKDLPPLEVGFQRLDADAEPWNHQAATVGFAAADLDNDRDLIEINDHAPCRVLINRRLGQWEAAEIPAEALPIGRYNGAVTADFNCDLRIDLMLACPDGAAVILHNEGTAGGFDLIPELKPIATDVQQLRTLQVIDADFDGWLDVVGLRSTGTRITLGSNRPRGMLARPEWLSGLVDEALPPQAVLVGDWCGTGWPQVLIANAGAAPTMLSTKGNGNHWIKLHAAGRREKTTSYDKKHPRSNPDGIGTRVIVHSGPNSVVWDNATVSAGPCQSLLPLPVGLGDRTKAEAIRLRWPSGVEQAELNLPADQFHTIEEVRRRDTSCPLLFAWNGRRFEFITDFLGGGGIGYMVAPGVYSDPDPDEDVFIDSRQLIPDERGNFVLKIAEPMDEMTYLDAAWLEVIDHPADTTVYPDERFDTAAAHPSGGRFVFRDRIVPAAARDHRGHDVRGRIQAWDRNTVDEFARSMMWIGYADDHFVELDFGQSFGGLKEDEPVALFLAGWVEYPYSQTNWAAATAGVELKPPVLKWLNEHGEWEPLIANMGYPAGLPRMMTLNLTGKLPAVVRGESGHGPLPLRLRIETNMEIYWDQIFAARLVPASTLRRTLLKPALAQLGYRGYLQEYSPDGHDPKSFDYHQIVSVPLIGLEGGRTPYGSVRPLVLEEDDQFVLINAGDEVTLTFDSRDLPPVPDGWTRSYVLRSFGYCKDTDLFNPSGRTVEPLPRKKRTE